MLEWHFNDYDGQGSAVEEYKYEAGKITFSAQQATSSGFGKITPHAAAFGAGEHQVVDVLRSLRKQSERYFVTLVLNERALPRREQNRLSKIQRRLPGRTQLLLPSIGRAEYAAFGPCNGYKRGAMKPAQGAHVRSSKASYGAFGVQRHVQHNHGGCG